MRDVGWIVDVWEKSRVGDRWDEVFYGHEVGVYDEDADYLVGVVVKPFSDCEEAVFPRTRIEEVAAGVAIVECLVRFYPMDFSLDCFLLA